MAKKKNVTQPQRLVLVLERLITLAKDEDFAEAFSEDLNGLLDDVHSNDGFGTEGQSDPRGDFREGTWDMSLVQGLDR